MTAGFLLERLDCFYSTLQKCFFLGRFKLFLAGTIIDHMPVVWFSGILLFLILLSSHPWQRMRSCQEHSDREGLKQQSLAKTMHANHKHYVLPGTCPSAISSVLCVKSFVTLASAKNALGVRNNYRPSEELNSLVRLLLRADYQKIPPWKD